MTAGIEMVGPPSFHLELVMVLIDPAADARPVDSLGGCLLRVVSTFGGMLALVACGVVILRRPSWTPGPPDAAFGGIALVTLAATYLDRVRFRAPGVSAAEGRRLVVVQALIALGIWVAAQSFQVFP